MGRDDWPTEEVLAQAAAQAAKNDPVLVALDAVFPADPLYQQICAELGEQGEVLLRMLLVKDLYQWSEQQTAEQVEDSLALRWFCRLGMRPAPTTIPISQAANQVSEDFLEALVNRVERARERAQSSEGRRRPEFRKRWR
jgi:transposase, IS5 family